MKTEGASWSVRGETPNVQGFKNANSKRNDVIDVAFANGRSWRNGPVVVNTRVIKETDVLVQIIQSGIIVNSYIY